ncbi:MAG: 3-isopropylmalate dehydratase large subunit, partial [Deltaproteobacteria bacterium]|nr:3-isopropylmalate dehydratase large subunit [Deltaproteobacteria bacterium]
CVCGKELTLYTIGQIGVGRFLYMAMEFTGGTIATRYVIVIFYEYDIRVEQYGREFQYNKQRKCSQT